MDSRWETARALPFTLPERERVTRIRQVDTATLLATTGARTQAMAGFEDSFRDIVDYIVRITERIWTDRAIGYIRDTYDASCTVYSNTGVVRSVDEVVAATIATIVALPEIEVHHINVAWDGDAAAGFYTSHLGWTRSLNVGTTLYGPATGREVGRRFIADCISRDNRIHTEWLVHDAGAVVRALGLSVDAAAAILADEAPREQLVVAAPFANAAHAAVAGDLHPGTPDGFARLMMHDVWAAKRLDRLADLYAPDAVAHSAGGRVAQGVRQIGDLMLRLMVSLPDGVMAVEHVCWSDETDGVILAVRWRLTGTTRRGGLLGDALPTGRLVSMLGASHYRFEGARIVEEWTVFDEVAAVAQALRG